MPGVIVGAFFLECSAQSHQLCSVESPSNDLVRFEQLIIHQADPTKYTTWVFFHEYSAWLSMLKYGQLVPMISSSLSYRSGSIFHHSDYTMQETLSFMPGKQYFTCKKLAFNVSRLQFMWNPILLLLNHSQWFQTIWNCLLVIPNVSANSFCVWHESSFNNASNSASSYTIGLPLHSLSSTSNSPFLNFWNHSRQLLSLKTASP